MYKYKTFVAESEPLYGPAGIEMPELRDKAMQDLNTWSDREKPHVISIQREEYCSRQLQGRSWTAITVFYDTRNQS